MSLKAKIMVRRSIHCVVYIYARFFFGAECAQRRSARESSAVARVVLEKLLLGHAISISVRARDYSRNGCCKSVCAVENKRRLSFARASAGASCNI